MFKHLRYYLVLIIVIIFSRQISAQHTLTVIVTDLRNNKGVVSAELLDQEKKTVAGKTEKITNNKCILVFENLKTEDYAFRFFHDENSNKKVEKNKIGIPVEGYGFSNDACGKFGPKKFEKWLFKVNRNTHITVPTHY